MKTSILCVAATACLFFVGCEVEETHDHHHDRVVVEPAYREVYVEGHPAPPPPREEIPERPHREAVWVPGHWERDRGYWVWERGHWE